MAEKLFDPKTQGPEHQHPEPDQHDLNPEAAAGENVGNVGRHPEKDNPRTAYDVKEAHRQLVDWTDDELKQIPLMPAGARLEQGATYVDLREPGAASSRPPARCRSPSMGFTSRSPRSISAPGTGCWVSGRPSGWGRRSPAGRRPRGRRRSSTFVMPRIPLPNSVSASPLAISGFFDRADHKLTLDLLADQAIGG